MPVPTMAHITNTKKLTHEQLVKFLVPQELKDRLQQLADERNISLSALMRLITSEYVKRHNGT
jgi:predicted transcriptional regulator